MVSGFVTLFFVLLLVGVITATLAAALMAHALLHPPRMNDGKALYVLRRLTPADLDMRFEEAAFTIRDEQTGRRLTIAGWWISAAKDEEKAAILLHGYADAKVGAIAWAPMFRALGYHVLAIDLRAHGESDGSICTAGFAERHDVSQVIDQLRADRPVQSRRLVLFGVSYGAAVAAATAVERRDAGDIAAVVLDSPFGDFSTASSKQMESMGLPGGWIRRAALAWAERQAKADFRAVAPVETIPLVPCPLMAVMPTEDTFHAEGQGAEIEAAFLLRRGGSNMDAVWKVAGAGHNMALVVAMEEYKRRLAEFLDNALTEPRKLTAAVSTSSPGEKSV